MNLEGVFPAHVTPFDRDGSIDYGTLAELVDHFVEGGVDGLVTAGCTGEAATLSHGEHVELIRRTVDAAEGRVPVIAGAGSNSTREALRLTGEAEDAGADAAMLITPYYNKPPQRGLEQHFTDVAGSTSLPVVLYNVPSRTGVNLEAETTLSLAEVENVVAVKEASGDLDQLSRIAEEAPPGFSVLSGDDGHALPALALGATGVVSVAANLVPGRVTELVRRAASGDNDGARGIHRELSPLFRALFAETNPIPVKRGLELLGIDAGDPRPPLTRLSADAEEELRSAMERLDLIQR